MIKIDKNTYKIDKKNYYQSKHNKQQIILGGSLRKENYHIIHLQKKESGNSKRWSTFSISRTGEIYQHYDPVYYSDYMENKEVDKKTISVVLENMGRVYYDYQTTNFKNWINEECHEDNVEEKIWRNCRYWEKYTSNQFYSTIELCKYLCEKYDVKLDTIGHNAICEDTINFNGIVTRSNFDADYDDLNPSFNWKLFLSELNIK